MEFDVDALIKNKEFDKLKEEIHKLSQKLEKTNKRFNKVLSQADAQQLQVIKIAEKLKILLDNTSDGFLQFDENMSIDSEYSKQVEIIFNQIVKNKNITNLLYPTNPEKAKKLQENLLYILDNPLQADIILSLLPKEFLINNKFIETEYKVLPDRKFMLILKDITEKKELQNKIEKENQILKMVVEVVVNKEQFLELKNKYLKFIENIDSLNKDTLKRELHTFKGLFAQKELLTLPKKLHQIESTLQIDKQKMKSWLYEDIKILESILGEEFFSVEYILIDKNRLNNISNQIISLTTNQQIINLVESLKYFNISQYLRQYKNLLNQLSVRFEKPIKAEFKIEEIYLPEKFKPFLDSLVHIFRNSIDHGIESLEERILNDKSEIATIECKVYQKDNILYIEIKDDGRGINIEKIKQKALQKGIIDNNQIKFLDDNIILNLIFEEGFSTNNEITTISGRGIGLNIVKKEVDKLNGGIKVFVNNGTLFKFCIPLDYQNAIISFLKNSKHLIENFLDEKLEVECDKFEKKDCYTIDINNSKLSISGNIKNKAELLNIIAGHLVTKFKANINTPYKKCIDIENSVKFYSDKYKIFIAFKG